MSDGADDVLNVRACGGEIGQARIVLPPQVRVPGMSQGRLMLARTLLTMADA
jgi:hypothetical protein